MRTRKEIWVVADLSPKANEVVANNLGADCEESQIGYFMDVDGEEHKGYYVPNHRFITDLKQLARRPRSGISFAVFKRQGEKFVRVNFDEMKKKKGQKVKS